MNIFLKCGLFVGVATLGSAICAGQQERPSQQESHIGDLTGHSADGQKAYQRSCIGCHGARGDGLGDNAPFVEPKPRDFTAGTFKCRSTLTGSLPTDQDLYNSLLRGFNTSAMPSWAPLTPQTRADLVAYVKTFSPRFAKEKPDPPIVIPAETPVTITSIKHGSELFQKLECWKCHGQQGRGDGPSASTLTDSKDQPIRPYDFTSGSRFKCGQTNTDLYRIFMTGVDGTPMPSFADNVKPDEAWDLVHYLRTLQIKRKSDENKVLRAAGGAKILIPRPAAEPAAPPAPAASPAPEAASPASAEPAAPPPADASSPPDPTIAPPASAAPATPPADPSVTPPSKTAPPASAAPSQPAGTPPDNPAPPESEKKGPAPTN